MDGYDFNLRASPSTGLAVSGNKRHALLKLEMFQEFISRTLRSLRTKIEEEATPTCSGRGVMRCAQAQGESNERCCEVFRVGQFAEPKRPGPSYPKFGVGEIVHITPAGAATLEVNGVHYFFGLEELKRIYVKGANADLPG